MDNNFNFNSPANNIMEIMKNGEDFIKKIKTGEGLGLSDDQKTEFKKQMENNSPIVQDLEEKMKQLRDIAKVMNPKI